MCSCVRFLRFTSQNKSSKMLVKRRKCESQVSSVLENKKSCPAASPGSCFVKFQLHAPRLQISILCLKILLTKSLNFGGKKFDLLQQTYAPQPFHYTSETSFLIIKGARATADLSSPIFIIITSRKAQRQTRGQSPSKASLASIYKIEL